MGTESSEKVALTSDDVVETASRVIVRVSPFGETTCPVPSCTLTMAVPPVTRQAPPRSAVPQPVATARPNESCASTFDAGAWTVTCEVVVVARPLSSVTVSDTANVPAAA